MNVVPVQQMFVQQQNNGSQILQFHGPVTFQKIETCQFFMLTKIKSQSTYYLISPSFREMMALKVGRYLSVSK